MAWRGLRLLRANQSGGMVLFLRPDVAGGCRAQLPRRDTAIGAGQLSYGECFADQRADPSLVGRFGGEKYSQRYVFTIRKCRDIVRRETAWRFVVPVPAQRDGYCAAEGVRTTAGLHSHNRVVSICLAGHRH